MRRAARRAHRGGHGRAGPGRHRTAPTRQALFVCRRKAPARLAGLGMFFPSKVEKKNNDKRGPGPMVVCNGVTAPLSFFFFDQKKK